MSIFGLLLLAVAAAILLYRAWGGWRYGATYELRLVIAILFGVLLAVYLWQPGAEALIGGVTLDARWVTTATFTLLFFAGSAVAGFVVRIKAPAYQSVKSDYANRALGALAGAFSGALLGGSLLWLATVANPDQFTAIPPARALAAFPQNVTRFFEARGAGVGPASPSRAKFPRTTLTQAPVDAKPSGAPAGATLMRICGEVAWE